MTFIDFYRDCFNYDRWANQRIIEALRGMETPPYDAVKMLAHILAAELLWLARILGGDYQGMDPWPILPIDECERLASEIHRPWNSLLDEITEEGLDQIIAYTNTRGVDFETSIRDILTHVGNHSTYHRAQIARMIREEGGKAPVTDYIAYVREVR